MSVQPPHSRRNRLIGPREDDKSDAAACVKNRKEMSVVPKTYGVVVTIAMVVGARPAATVEGRAVMAPVAGFIENPDIVPPNSLATYANFPEGSNAIDVGPEPVANGDPLIIARAPLAASIENTDTVAPGKGAPTLANQLTT